MSFMNTRKAECSCDACSFNKLKEMEINLPPGETPPYLSRMASSFPRLTEPHFRSDPCPWLATEYEPAHWCPPFHFWCQQVTGVTHLAYSPRASWAAFPYFRSQDPSTGVTYGSGDYGGLAYDHGAFPKIQSVHTLAGSTRVSHDPLFNEREDSSPRLDSSPAFGSADADVTQPSVMKTPSINIPSTSETLTRVTQKSILSSESLIHGGGEIELSTAADEEKPPSIDSEPCIPLIEEKPPSIDSEPCIPLILKRQWTLQENSSVTHNTNTVEDTSSALSQISKVTAEERACMVAEERESPAKDKNEQVSSCGATLELRDETLTGYGTTKHLRTQLKRGLSSHEHLPASLNISKNTLSRVEKINKIQGRLKTEESPRKRVRLNTNVALPKNIKCLSDGSGSGKQSKKPYKSAENIGGALIESPRDTCKKAKAMEKEISLSYEFMVSVKERRNQTESKRGDMNVIKRVDTNQSKSCVDWQTAPKDDCDSTNNDNVEAQHLRDHSGNQSKNCSSIAQSCSLRVKEGNVFNSDGDSERLKMQPSASNNGAENLIQKLNDFDSEFEAKIKNSSRNSETLSQSKEDISREVFRMNLFEKMGTLVLKEQRRKRLENIAEENKLKSSQTTNTQDMKDNCTEMSVNKTQTELSPLDSLQSLLEKFKDCRQAIKETIASEKNDKSRSERCVKESNSDKRQDLPTPSSHSDSLRDNCIEKQRSSCDDSAKKLKHGNLDCLQQKPLKRRCTSLPRKMTKSRREVLKKQGRDVTVELQNNSSQEEHAGKNKDNAEKGEVPSTMPNMGSKKASNNFKPLAAKLQRTNTNDWSIPRASINHTACWEENHDRLQRQLELRESKIHALMCKRDGLLQTIDKMDRKSDVRNL